MKIAVVSTYRTSCGVGIYCEQLMDEIAKLVEVKIFAEKTNIENPKIISKDIPYDRCYVRGQSYDEILSKIVQYKPDVVHVQFESSMYQESYMPNSPFLKFIDALHLNNIKTVITMHNILPFPNFNSQEVQAISSWYRSLNSEIIVGNKAMKLELLKWAPMAKISIIPLGSTLFVPVNRKTAIERLKLNPDKIYIVQTGFYGADKGMVQLVKLLPKLIELNPKIQLVFAGGLHPLAPEAWKLHVKEAIKEAIKLKVTANLTFLGRFVSEDEVNLWLSAADIVMLNYHGVSGLYSASASGKRVLCSGKPIIMNTADIRLSEFEDHIHCCKVNDEYMLNAIIGLITDTDYGKKLADGARKYAYATRFPIIARKHMNIYAGEKQLYCYKCNKKVEEFCHGGLCLDCCSKERQYEIDLYKEE